MPFQDANATLGINPKGRVQVGRSDADDSAFVERNADIPWSSDKSASYVYYECTVAVVLDSGVVVHNRLPQVDPPADTLSSANLADPNLDQLAEFGVNLRSQDQYTDVVQRMAHSRYWFRLSGQALRVGYKVPIPGLKVVGGVTAVPFDREPQWAFNRIAPGGNYGGVPLWHASWSLWYTTATQPRVDDLPAVDLEAHVSGGTKLPAGIKAPYSEADDNAQVGGGLDVGFGVKGR